MTPVSAVIAAIDEAARIVPLLKRLAALRVTQSIVVDGGSSDATVQLARAHGAHVVQSQPGRGQQLNAGAAVASESTLWFLHADVIPPDNALTEIARLLAAPHVAGTFRTRTQDDRPGRAKHPSWLSLADLRGRYTGLPYGDQSLFLRAETFHQAGGYPAQSLMEDIEIARRLRRLGTIATSPARMLVSGRRFVQQPLRSFVMMNTFPTLYRLGVSPERLARLYRAVR